MKGRVSHWAWPMDLLVSGLGKPEVRGDSRRNGFILIPLEVSIHVVLVGGGLGETFATLLALIWLFSRVDSLMRSKVPGLSESFGAEPALEWLLTRMNTHVHLKGEKFKVSE